MPHGDDKKAVIRGETDASLDAERAKTDKELASRGVSVEEDADAGVRTARARADAVLGATRRRQDDTSGRATEDVVRDRRREDAAIAQERNVADATLAAERVRRQIALAGILVVERQETDSRLLLERVRADESLAHRDDFLAMVSHDMRGLISSIALNVSILETHGRDDRGALARTAASIKRTTAQMSRLVADLLDLATLDAGKLVLLRGRYDAVSVVREAANAFQLAASQKEITLSVDVPNEELLADFDPDRIAQVLGNLLGNAAKFTRPSGKITVAVEPLGRDVRFSVADTGEGIAPENLETIFERYSQVARADRRGLGLGLYISRRIVEAHGGRLWVASTAGKGSTFFFSLPRQPFE